MKLFIDTGNLKDIEALVPLGIIDGVTTNPSLMAKEGGDPRADHQADLRDRAGAGQRRGRRDRLATAMIAEGRDLATIDEHIVVKVPFTRDGVRATKTLAERGHPRQRHAHLLADAGAARRQGRRGLRQPVRRPARRHRVGRHGADPSRSSRSSTTTSSRTEILVASVRHPMHIVEAARMGADVCTCPASVIEACFKHPLTDIGLEKFLKDWEKAQAAQEPTRDRDSRTPRSSRRARAAAPSSAAAKTACAGSTRPAS